MINTLNKWNKSTVLSLALAGGLILSLSPNAVQAETSEDLVEQKATIDEATQKLEQNITLLKKEINTQLIKFNNLQVEITKVNKEITNTEERIAARAEIIGKRAAAYQEQDNTVGLYLSVLLDSESFADLLDRAQAVKTIMDADQEMMNEQKKDKEALAEQQKELTKKQEALEEQFQKLQTKEYEVELKIAENKAKSASLQLSIEEKQAAEKEYQALLALQEQTITPNSADKGNTVASKASSSEKSTAVTNTTVMNTNAKKSENTQTSASTASASNLKVAQKAISVGSQFIGNAYVWGGSTPKTGFDCSGLVQWSYKQAGISLPRSSSQQYLASQKISKGEAKAGDLVFFSYGSGVAHVGIYLGNNKMLNAQNSGVKIESLDWWNKYLVGFGRIPGVN